MGLEVDVERLLERTLHLRGIVNGTGDGERVFWVGAKVSIALFMRREQRRTPCQIENYITLGFAAILRRPEFQCTTT